MSASPQQQQQSEWTQLMGEELLIKNNPDKNNDPTTKIPELQPQDVVTISFTGRLAMSTPSFSCSDAVGDADDDLVVVAGPIFQQALHWTIVIGDKDVVNAVEMGVRFMTHKTARVYSHSKFALGPGTRRITSSNSSSTTGKDNDENSTWSTLPAHANVIFDITIHEIIESVHDRVLLQLCKTRKIIGNDIFHHEHIQQHEFAKHRALHQYKKAIAILESLYSKKVSSSLTGDEGDKIPANTTVKDEEEEDASFRDEIWQCLLDCRNNIAAVHLSCQEYHAAKLACIETLKLDASNATALVRAAKACLYDPSSSFLEATKTIQAAQMILPEKDARLQSLQRQLYQLKSAHQQKQRIMASKMAKGTTTTSSRNSSSKETNHNKITSSPTASDYLHKPNDDDVSFQDSSRIVVKPVQKRWSFWIVPILGLLLAMMVQLLMAVYQYWYS